MPNAAHIFKVPQHISQSIFRMNDIRGTLGETLSEDVVYATGLALGSFLKEAGQNTFVVGCDSRASSPLLSMALIEGLTSTGCNVTDIGAVPTPVLYFATRTLDATSGAMITGSHNPLNDNGIKIVLQGTSISHENLLLLLQRIKEKNFSSGQGQKKFLDILPNYINAVIEKIHFKRKLRVIVDCGNAIPGKVAPEVLKRLGCDVIPLFCEVKETFPHHFPDPTEPKNLQDLIQAVKNNQADLGLAFDGDGDRLGVVTNNGEIIWPDRQLMLFATDVLLKNPGATIIYDVKCSMHLRSLIHQYHGVPLMWKTGHSLIEDKLHETNALLAGEMSGHFFFNDHWFGFDDGIYSAARLIEILAKYTQTSAEIFHSLPNSVNTPEIRVSISDEEKFSFIEKFKKIVNFPSGKITTLDGVRVDFDFGFCLVRASNTTPALILRFEADNEDNLKRIQKIFKHQLLSVEPNLTLPF